MLEYDDGWVKQYCGNALEVLADMLGESVQMVVTSPPYWGLRRYSGNQDLVWGGNNGCEHEWIAKSSLAYKPESGVTTRWQHRDAHYPNENPESYENWADLKKGTQMQGSCSLCGAVKCSFGLEKSPEEYIAHSIEFLRAIRRVLRRDGVVFWNIGDSYGGGAGGYWASGDVFDSERLKSERLKRDWQKHPTIKPKDLCLIPFRLAIAAQEDGWYIRSIIIWSKNNPMPESVRDRPTESHEYILMMTKSARYYYDQEAVREKLVGIPTGMGGLAQRGTLEKSDRADWHWDKTMQYLPSNRNLRSVWTFPTEPFGYEMCKSCKIVYERRQYRRLAEKAGGHKCKCANQIKDYIPSWLETIIDSQIEVLGDVVDIKEQGYQCEYCGTIYTREQYEILPEAKIKICRCGESDWLSHFATYPTELVKRCILAATSERGNCEKCGKPWVRVVERKNETRTKTDKQGQDRSTLPEWSKGRAGEMETQTLGWSPGCKCGISETVPCAVLDPFSGSGTTGQVAKELGRKAILIDMSEEYTKLAIDRVSRVSYPMDIVGTLGQATQPALYPLPSTSAGLLGPPLD